MTDPDTTICIPAYRAEGFVADAIESALAQSHGDIRILVSVDPAGDGTEDICRRYTTDPRLELVINHTRLGWIGNSNACLARIETPFYAFCFHDDRMHPDFVARLRPELLDHPEAVSAAGAIEHFGDVDMRVEQPNLDGSPFDRVLTRLAGTYGNSYSLKTLMRSAPVHDGLRLPRNVDGYYGDWPFSVAYALAGTFRGVPETLYYKRMWPGSVTAGWTRIGLEDRIEAEIGFRAEILRLIQTAQVLTPAEKTALTEIMLHRITGRPDLAEDAETFAEALRGRGTAEIMTRLVNGDGAGAAPPLGAGGAEDSRAARASMLEQSARWLGRQGATTAALADARRALVHAPERASLHIYCARLLMQLGRTGRDQALDHAARAMENAPDDWEAHLVHARLCAAGGDRDAARISAIRAQELAPPDTPAIEKLLKRLDRDR
ncbi:MAG: glycosyltransferase [Roseovarius sp.]